MYRLICEITPLFKSTMPPDEFDPHGQMTTGGMSACDISEVLIQSWYKKVQLFSVMGLSMGIEYLILLR